MQQKIHIFTDIFRAENFLHWKEYKDFQVILYSFQVNAVFFHDTFGTLKDIFKISFSKNTFSKLIPEKYIIKIAPSKNTFSKNAFSKLLPHKMRFKNFIFIIVFFKNINFIALIYSSPESSES